MKSSALPPESCSAFSGRSPRRLQLDTSASGTCRGGREWTTFSLVLGNIQDPFTTSQPPQWRHLLRTTATTSDLTKSCNTPSGCMSGWVGAESKLEAGQQPIAAGTGRLRGCCSQFPLLVCGAIQQRGSKGKQRKHPPPPTSSSSTPPPPFPESLLAASLMENCLTSLLLLTQVLPSKKKKHGGCLCHQ